jgi:hypothetical protein
MTRGQNIVSNLQSVYSANNSAWLVQCRPDELAKRIDDAVECALFEPEAKIKELALLAMDAPAYKVRMLTEQLENANRCADESEAEVQELTEKLNRLTGMLGVSYHVGTDSEGCWRNDRAEAAEGRLEEVCKQCTEKQGEILALRSQVKEQESLVLDYKKKRDDDCHNHKVMAEQRDAAIAVAVKQRTMECAELCLTTHAFTVFEIRQCIKAAILALDSYPFEKPCKCWRPDELGSKVWRHDLPEPSNYVLLPIYDNNCRYCGARRKG